MIVHCRRRTGFTLVEIMIVLAIIGILVALSMAAVMRIMNAQQIHSSSDVVEKVQLAIDNQYKAIIAQAQIDIRGQGATQDAQQLINYFNGDADAALAMLTYCRVRQSFPQTFAEVQQLPTTSVNGVNVPYFSVGGAFFPLKSQFLPFANAATMPSTNLTPAQQSAALLYAAVAQTGAGGSTFVSDDATTGNQMDFKQTGAVTIHVYMDSWKQPIGFCRFGTNPELQVAPYVNSSKLTVSNDTLDPSGKLATWASTNASAATTAYAYLFAGTGAADASSFSGSNRRPVVYSYGLNRVYEQLGNTPMTPGIPSDDILGYRLTQLGQKGTK